MLVVVYVFLNVSCFVADVMVGMGFNLEEIQESLAKMKYDEITATYLLLGRKASEVQVFGFGTGSLLFIIIHSPPFYIFLVCDSWIRTQPVSILCR